MANSRRVDASRIIRSPNRKLLNTNYRSASRQRRARTSHRHTNYNYHSPEITTNISTHRAAASPARRDPSSHHNQPNRLEYRHRRSSRRDANHSANRRYTLRNIKLNRSQKRSDGSRAHPRRRAASRYSPARNTTNKYFIARNHSEESRENPPNQRRNTSRHCRRTRGRDSRSYSEFRSRLTTKRKHAHNLRRNLRTTNCPNARASPSRAYRRNRHYDLHRSQSRSL